VSAASASDAATGLAVALGAGLLIGLERERRKRQRHEAGEPGAPAAAGIRTFAVVALAGALAQLLAEPLLLTAGALAVAALVALAYRASLSARGAAGAQAAVDPGLTTEVALLATYFVGALAIGQPALAAAVGVTLAVLLAARERMHRLANHLLTEAELHDALLLATLGGVLLPLLPATPLAWLGGIAPRSLLWLLLLILLLQAAGHVAARVVGPGAGLALAGFFSGFVSSTATIATLGAKARGAAPAQAAACRTGAILSTAATWVQALALLTAMAPAAAIALAPAAGAALLLTALAALLSWRGVANAGETATLASGRATVPLPRSARGPLRLREAAVVAAFLWAVAVAVAWAGRQFGSAGTLAGVALAGLADAHAPVAALSALHSAGALDTAAVRDGTLFAIAANSLTRTLVGWGAGGAGFGRPIAALLSATWAAAAAVAWLS
jgi:uncharacterized membrane protein (DUF4010 family)